jgi:hypothetical protein
MASLTSPYHAERYAALAERKSASEAKLAEYLAALQRQRADAQDEHVACCNADLATVVKFEDELEQSILVPYQARIAAGVAEDSPQILQSAVLQIDDAIATSFDGAPNHVNYLLALATIEFHAPSGADISQVMGRSDSTTYAAIYLAAADACCKALRQGPAAGSLRFKELRGVLEVAMHDVRGIDPWAPRRLECYRSSLLVRTSAAKCKDLEAQAEAERRAVPSPALPPRTSWRTALGL